MNKRNVAPSATQIFSGNSSSLDRWGDTGVDSRIIFGWIFRKLNVGVWTGLGWRL
jgi:hypothetical protein